VATPDAELWHRLPLFMAAVLARVFSTRAARLAGSHLEPMAESETKQRQRPPCC
jgi:hypothetical protein